MKNWQLISNFSALILGLSGFFCINEAQAVSLKANFKLYGEVNRFSDLGFGNLEFHFGINPTGGLATGDQVISSGLINFPLFQPPTASGVFAPLNLPSSGFGIVDLNFAVPFELETEQEASLFIGFGTSKSGSPTSGSKQVVFDFSNDIQFVGSILPPGQEGLTLTSLTLADGTSLNDAGLRFEFIPENTILTAYASSVDDGGNVGEENQAIPPNIAKVSLPPAIASVQVNPIINLSVNPEPNPFVFDLASASISGTRNIILTKTSTKIPETTPTLGLLAFAVVSITYFRINRNKKFNS